MNVLYATLVTHTRTRPRAHKLAYQVPYLLLDLDNMPALRFFSQDCFNLVSLRTRDHGDGTMPLRTWVQAQLETPAARITLLTMPRILGLGFNPLSLYFCYGADDRLQTVIYEVNNTFGQRHCYVCPVAPGEAAPLHQGSEKLFYVSPFMEMGLRYSFTLTPPGEAVGLHIAVEDADGVMLRATMAGRRQKLSDAALLRLVLSQPWLGAKVFAAINWEALKMLAKGFRWRARPDAPRLVVSTGYARPRSVS
jgi:DUF1365 family protein